MRDCNGYKLRTNILIIMNIVIMIMTCTSRAKVEHYKGCSEKIMMYILNPEKKEENIRFAYTPRCDGELCAVMKIIFLTRTFPNGLTYHGGSV